ncbi:hypothetical protein RB597_005220 [Gaeumannomyces tritici]
MIINVTSIYKLKVRPSPRAALLPAPDVQTPDRDVASFDRYLSTLPHEFQELAAHLNRTSADLREARTEIRGLWAQLFVFNVMMAWHAQLAVGLGTDAHRLIERQRQSLFGERIRHLGMIQERQQRLQAMHGLTVARFHTLLQRWEDEKSKMGALRKSH